MKVLPQHNLHSKSSLPASSAKVHERMKKESPFKIMYIMAAVDCDFEG